MIIIFERKKQIVKKIKGLIKSEIAEMVINN